MGLAIYSLWHREIVRFLRDRSRVFGSIGQPILFWLLFAGALRNASFSAGSVDLHGVGYGQYFFVGVLVMIVLFTSVFTTITVIEDRREGFLQGVLVSPVSRASIALGKITGGATLAMLHAIVFLCLAPLAGVPLSVSGVALALVALVLISFALVGLGFSLAWRMDSTAGYHGIMMVVLMPMWLLSGAMFPVQSAHPVLAFIMRCNPVTYGVAALRYAFYGSDSVTVQGLPSAATAWTVTVVFGVVMFALATAVTMRRSTRDAS